MEADQTFSDTVSALEQVNIRISCLANQLMSASIELSSIYSNLLKLKAMEEDHASLDHSSESGSSSDSGSQHP
ncbi:MAG: hypothetical protein D6746_06480 [Bacteroidetes bacterium]|nr:MAG: hypothetical protein D6746_06480 [Bacteroidota bacterium]